MTLSKSRPMSRLSNFFSRSEPTLLQPVQELEEEESSEAVPNKRMIQQPRLQRQHSRFQRLSQFISPALILATDSEILQDPQKPPHKDQVLRKPVPSQYRQPSIAPLQGSAPADSLTSEQNRRPASSHKLHKATDSASYSKPLPRAQSPGPTPTTPDNGRLRGSSLAPPASTDAQENISVSSPVNSRPNSYHSEGEVEGDASSRLRRKSWLRGKSRSRNVSQDLDSSHGSTAWVYTKSHKVDYDLSPLVNGEKVRQP